MNPNWRAALFDQKPTRSGLNTLVLPMTNAQAIRILGICFRTWNRWEDVAMKIPQYKLKQLRMQQYAKTHNLSGTPIEPYQVWVIGKIGEIFEDISQGISKTALVVSIVEADKSRYSQSEFEQEQLQRTSLALGETTNV